MVRAISMQPTDGLVRGSAVRDTGAAISVPVGDATKGHVFNALGQPLDVAERRRRHLLADPPADARPSTSSRARPRCS